MENRTPPDTAVRFRDRVKLLLEQLMEERGITAHAAAHEAGIDPSLAAKVLKGLRQTVGAKVVDKMAVQMNLRPGWFTDAEVTHYRDYRGRGPRTPDVVERFIENEPRCSTEDAVTLRRLNWGAFTADAGLVITDGIVRSIWQDMALTRATRQEPAELHQKPAPKRAKLA